MATNPYQVQVAPLNFYDGQLSSVTKSYHGFSILNGAGAEVGRVMEWSFAVFGRDGRHLKELSRFTWGRYVDYVPGGTNAPYTITVSRAEIWGNEFELALGESESYEDLTDQTAPFRLVENLYQGNTIYEQYEYVGCWWQEKNIQGYSAEGDGVVMVDGSIAFVSRSRTT